MFFNVFCVFTLTSIFFTTMTAMAAKKRRRRACGLDDFFGVGQNLYVIIRWYASFSWQM